MCNIGDIGKVGKCPFCGSEDTDYCFVHISPPRNGIVRNGFSDIWCNDCGKFECASTRNVPVDKLYKIYTDTEYEAHQERRKNGERVSLTPAPTFTDERLVAQVV